MDSDDERKDYNPDQPLEVRRRITRGIRNLEKDMHENAEDYLHPTNSKITDTLATVNDYFQRVQQTNEATIDSKAIITLADLGHRKLQRLTAGNLGNGIDPDEFVSKCVTYMKLAKGIAEGDDDEEEELTHTQRHRRAPPGRRGGPIGSDDDDDDDEDGNTGDMLDWVHLGRYACTPNVRRPAGTGFLLGPLAAEKKVRKVVTRSAPLRLRDLQEVRPEVLDTADLAKNEKQDLTAICRKILTRLKHVRQSAFAQLEEIHEDEDKTDEDVSEAMERLGITELGNVDLVRFCINPKSFGQTVENMFYVSFLIREGMVQVQYEENGLPSLLPVEESEQEQQSISKSRHGTMKRQAILSIDVPTWNDLIQTFNIKESMIEHRKEVQTQGPGARGWYS